MATKVEKQLQITKKEREKAARRAADRAHSAHAPKTEAYGKMKEHFEMAIPL